MKLKGGALLLILLLASCAKFNVKDSAKNPQPLSQEQEAKQENEYQIGDQWSLKETTDTEDLKKSIFTIRSEFNATMGKAIYLGRSGEDYIFLTNSHLVSDILDTCDDYVNIYNNEGVLFTCSSGIEGLPELDAVLVRMRRVKEDMEPKALKLSNRKATVKENLRLSVVEDIDAASVLYQDQSTDCKVLSNSDKVMGDIDSYRPVNTLSFSQPIGCDAAHGNSGAPILNSNNEVVGILWTGKTPKQFVSSKKLTQLVEKQDPKVWTDFNLMVPSEKILEKMAQIGFM